MFDVQTTDAFDAWLDELDKTAQRRLAARLRKLSCGLWGDAKPVGEGVSELREHFGPGYRLYATQRGPVLIVVLGAATSRRSVTTSLAPSL